jgi:hypothetical protein
MMLLRREGTIFFLSLVVVAACKKDEGTAEEPEPTCESSVADQVPTNLACSGLYSNWSKKTLSPTAKPYAPAVPFWSDGYDKSRFIQIPDGQKIDATDIDEWIFPVGTKVWKEFRRGDKKVETRLFWKVSADKWSYASYAWSEDGKEAPRANVDGQEVSVDGKPYNIPSLAECNQCHRGKKDKLLGVEALSLAQPSAQGLTLAALAQANLIAPAPSRTTATLPNPAVAYLHINCGVSCHSNVPTAEAVTSTLRLRVGFEESTKPVTEWELYKTSFKVASELPALQGTPRISPGIPEQSSIITTMKATGTGQMPPIARREIDTQGLGTLETWVRSLPTN